MKQELECAYLLQDERITRFYPAKAPRYEDCAPSSHLRFA